jgi:hypothetical protein
MEIAACYLEFEDLEIWKFGNVNLKIWKFGNVDLKI